MPPGPEPATAPPRARVHLPTNIRWGLVILLFFGMSIQSLDRVNLSAALPVISKDFALTPVLQGLILSAFFWTYAAMNIPAGYIVDRLRPRRAFTIIGLLWALVTMATALANGFLTLFGLRALLGIGEAGDFPTATAVVGEWFPPQERGLASGIFSVGNDGGVVIALPLSAFLLIHFGWPAVFVGSGLIGLIWVIIWWRQYYAPANHPRVSAEERAYVASPDVDLAGKKAGKSRRWIDLLRYRQTWGLIVGYFCYPYLYGFFLTWLPTYLVKARHFSIAELGLFGAIPALFALAGGLVGGRCSDLLMTRVRNVNVARKVPIGVGMVVGSLAIIAAAYVPSVFGALALLSTTTFFMRGAYGAIWSLPVDVSPGQTYTASISGLMNAFGNLGGGVIAPIVTGILLAATGSFVVPLVVAGIVAIVGAGAFIFGVGPIRPLWEATSS